MSNGIFEGLLVLIAFFGGSAILIAGFIGYARVRAPMRPPARERARVRDIQRLPFDGSRHPDWPDAA